MSTLTFDVDKDSVAEARLIVAALTEWLAEEKDTPDPAGRRVQFCYRPDTTLDSIITLPPVGA
ncbi:hypothetical protein [Pseudomonas sp. LB3P14]